MLSQNYQHCFKNWYLKLSKLSKKLKYGIWIFVGQAVLELLIKTCKILFWSVPYLKNSRPTVWPTELLMPDILVLDSYIIFQKKVLIILRQCTKHAQFWFRVQFLLKLGTKHEMFIIWHWQKFKPISSKNCYLNVFPKWRYRR